MPNNYILTSAGSFISENELYHHGVKGMKWGVRKYQNPDGSLTAAGKSRYDTVEEAKAMYKKAKKHLLIIIIELMVQVLAGLLLLKIREKTFREILKRITIL